MNFVPCHNGMLECDVVINGHRSTNCTLKSKVTWALNNAYGCGAITNNGLTMTAEQFAENYHYRLGDCSFSSGINTWVVQIVHRCCDRRYYRRYDLGYKPAYRRDSQSTRHISPTCAVEIGVVEYNVCQTCAKFEQEAEKWVYKVPSHEVTSVSFILDLNENMLTVISYEGDNGEPNVRYELYPGTFSPFFAVTSEMQGSCEVSVLV